MKEKPIFNNFKDNQMDKFTSVGQNYSTERLLTR